MVRQKKREKITADNKNNVSITFFTYQEESLTPPVHLHTKAVYFSQLGEGKKRSINTCCFFTSGKKKSLVQKVGPPVRVHSRWTSFRVRRTSDHLQLTASEVGWLLLVTAACTYHTRRVRTRASKCIPQGSSLQHRCCCARGSATLHTSFPTSRAD